jgi:signal transduction histidine kinase
VVPALCFAAFTAPVLVGAADGHGSDLAVGVLGALAVLPLAWSRRGPVAALAVVAAVLCVASLTGVQFTGFVSNAGPALGLAAYAVAVLRPRRAAVVAVAVSALGVSAAAIVAYHLHPDHDQDLVQLPIAAAGWLVGDVVRARRRLSADLAATASVAAAEAEARVRAEERLSVSREVHDVVSHALAMIAVRAGVARVVIDSRPAEARDALSAIEGASRDALDELRTVLRGLREPGPESEALDGPTLSDVQHLVTRMEDAGHVVRLEVHGDAGYPALLESSAYRMLQEALTNVAKHAPGAQVEVTLRREAHELVVSVVDDGGAPRPDDVRPGPGSPGAGLGLLGIRERADLFGGSAETGRRADGGFGVVVRLPVRGSSSTHTGGDDHADALSS